MRADERPAVCGMSERRFAVRKTRKAWAPGPGVAGAVLFFAAHEKFDAMLKEKLTEKEIRERTWGRPTRMAVGQKMIAALSGLSERQLRARLNPNNAEYDPKLAALVTKQNGKYVAYGPYLHGHGIMRLWQTMEMRGGKAKARARRAGKFESAR